MNSLAITRRNQIDDSMGEVASHRIPPAPRLVLSGMALPPPIAPKAKKHEPVRTLRAITLMPLVDDDWQPIKDRWVLPGCRVLTHVQVCALALANGWGVSIIN